MIDDKIQKANEGLTKLTEVVQSKGWTKWLIVGAAVLLVIIVGMVLWPSKAHAGGSHYGDATAIAGAVAGAHATSAAVGLGGAGGAGGGSSATVNDSSKSWALGLPALAGSGNGCTESFSLVVAASWMTPVCRLQHELAVVESLPMTREAKDIAKLNVACKYEFVASAAAVCAGRK